MPPIVTSAETDRPAPEVFAYATDPSRFSEWQNGMVDGHGQPDSDCGRQVRDNAADRRPNRPSASELVRYDPPRTWTIRGIDGPIRAAVDVVVEPVDDSRSRLTISVDFAGQGIGKILVRPRHPELNTAGSNWVRHLPLSPPRVVGFRCLG